MIKYNDNIYNDNGGDNDIDINDVKNILLLLLLPFLLLLLSLLL